MFQDVKESIEISNEFRQTKGKHLQGIDVNFRILQQKTWPITQGTGDSEASVKEKQNKKKHQGDEEMQTTQIMQVSLPKPLSSVFQQFAQFYLSKSNYKGRKLDYYADYGSCVLKASLGNTFMMKTNIMQALVLLQFNGPANKPSAKLTAGMI